MGTREEECWASGMKCPQCRALLESVPKSNQMKCKGGTHRYELRWVENPAEDFARELVDLKTGETFPVPADEIWK